jgi:hypothetical protein
VKGDRRWYFALLVLGAVVLLYWGLFVLGFLGQPSAVDRVRVALIVIGGGSLAVGAGCAAAATWMLFARRT